MSQFPFDLHAAIAEWRSQLNADGITKTADLDELESHLLEDIDRLIETGVTNSEAFLIATQKIGQPALVKNEFKKVENQRIYRVVDFLLPFSILVGTWATTENPSVITRSLYTVWLFTLIYSAILKNRFLNHTKRVRLRPYALVVNFISAALLTGPEIIAQAITALMLQLVFELLVWRFGRQERHFPAARE